MYVLLCEKRDIYILTLKRRSKDNSQFYLMLYFPGKKYVTAKFYEFGMSS